MAALKDKALTLLGSATVDIHPAASTTIFTTPIGKVTRISHIILRDPQASLAAATDLKFGTGFRNNAAVDVSSLTTTGTDYIVLQNATAAGSDQKCTEIAAGTAFQVTVTTGATANPANVTIDVFGYTT